MSEGSLNINSQLRMGREDQDTHSAINADTVVVRDGQKG